MTDIKRVVALPLAAMLAASVVAQQAETYDYWLFNRDMIRYGQ